ncbi:MAG: hypothetical protein ACKODS_04635 [Methylophilaceae bacterium]
MKTKYAIIENAKIQARMCFAGIAIPHQPSLAEGVYGPIQSEKVLKFNRKALRRLGKSKVEKTDPRLVGGEDTMIIKVGKPGSRERVEALAEQYAAIMAHNEEISPFSWRDDE